MSFREEFVGLRPREAVDVSKTMLCNDLTPAQMALAGKARMSSVELLIKTSIRQLDIVKEIFQLDNLYFHMAHLVSRQAKVGHSPCDSTANQHQGNIPSIDDDIPLSHGVHVDDCPREEGQCIVRTVCSLCGWCYRIVGP